MAASRPDSPAHDGGQHKTQHRSRLRSVPRNGQFIATPPNGSFPCLCLCLVFVCAEGEGEKSAKACGAALHQLVSSHNRAVPPGLNLNYCLRNSDQMPALRSSFV